MFWSITIRSILVLWEINIQTFRVKDILNLPESPASCWRRIGFIGNQASSFTPLSLQVKTAEKAHQIQAFNAFFCLFFFGQNLQVHRCPFLFSFPSSPSVWEQPRGQVVDSTLLCLGMPKLLIAPTIYGPSVCEQGNRLTKGLIASLLTQPHDPLPGWRVHHRPRSAALFFQPAESFCKHCKVAHFWLNENELDCRLYAY